MALPSYPNNTDVSVTIPFVDMNGVSLSAANMQLSYQVLDSLENVILSATALPTPSATDTNVRITIAAIYNVLQGPQPNLSEGVIEGNAVLQVADIREIQLTMVTLDGTYVAKTQYFVRATDAQLVLLQNSFQTYNLSLLTADGIPNLNGWLTSTEAQRIQALQEAYRRLTRLGYFVRWPRDPDAQNYLNWFSSRNEIIIPRLWAVMKTDRWYNYYPEQFRQSMRNAQIVEADDVLTNDVFAARRAAGVLVEKIGESDIEFRDRAPLKMGLGRRACEYLQGYLDMKLTIRRG